jgi:hypothetical protein
MNFQIMSRLQRIIFLATVMAILSLFSNCKKSSSVDSGRSSNSASADTSLSTTWFFRLVVNDSTGNNIIKTFVSGSGLEGYTSTSLDSPYSILTGGNTVGNNSTYNGVPGMNMIVGSGGCDTGITTNPCYLFEVGVQSIDTGTYVFANNACQGCAEALNNNEIMFKPSQIYQYNTYWLVDSLNSMGVFSGTLVAPPASLTFNITQMGHVGENIRGNFKGTMIQTNGSTNALATQTVNVSGSFNVYRVN